MRKKAHGDDYGELLTYKQAAERSNLGVGAVMRIAKESGALVKVGKTARVIYKEFFDYVIEKYRIKKED